MHLTNLDSEPRTSVSGFGASFGNPWGRRPRLRRAPWPGLAFTGRPKPANAPAAGHGPAPLREFRTHHTSLTLQMMIEVLEPRSVIFLALRRFLDRVVVRRNHARKICPWLGEHGRIFHGGLIRQ